MLDVRVGTIVSLQDVPNSCKLVQMQVDLGFAVRRVLAGLTGARDDPPETTGRQALLVVKLKPQKMAGLTSETMLFDIGYADGIRPVLAQPEDPAPKGERAGERRKA